MIAFPAIRLPMTTRSAPATGRFRGRGEVAIVVIPPTLRDAPIGRS